MKKIFSIFFLMLALFPLQAYIYQTSVTTIRSTVSKITLSQAAVSEDSILGLYKLYGGLEPDVSSGLDYLMANDISRGDITVYLHITQLAKTRTDESIQLSVEAECLMNTDSQLILSQDPQKHIATGSPMITDIICSKIDAVNIIYSRNMSNKIQFSLSYLGKAVEGVDLAFFTTTWKKTEGLEPGIYTAKITLSYIMN